MGCSSRRSGSWSRNDPSAREVLACVACVALAHGLSGTAEIAPGLLSTAQEARVPRETIDLVFDPPLDRAIPWLLDARIELEVTHCEKDDNIVASALPDVGQSLSLAWHAAYDETVRASSADRPCVLTRRWNALELDLASRGHPTLPPEDRRLKSMLVGDTTRHVRTPTGEDHEVTRIDGAGRVDVAIVESLAPLVPFAPVLAGRTSPAATKWEVDGGELVRGLWVGGFGPLRRNEPTTQSMARALVLLPPAPELWTANVAGEVDATLGDHARAGDHARLAIDLSFALRGTVSVDAWLAWMRSDPGANPLALDQSSRGDEGFAWRCAGRGTLVWSTSEHRLLSLSLEGDLVVTTDFRWFYALSPYEAVRNAYSDEWTGTCRIEMVAGE